MLSVSTYSQVSPFPAVYTPDSNGSPNCVNLDTNNYFTILQHSGIVDAVTQGLFLMDYSTQTFAIDGWYSDDGIIFYYWSGSGWDPAPKTCGSVTGFNALVNKSNSFRVNVYPNPTNGVITLNVKDQKGALQVEVYDLSGRLLITTSSSVINLEHYKKGIYIIKVIAGDKYKQIKVFRK